MTELSIIVDKNDNIIWYKDRSLVKDENDIHRVSILWIENSKWEVLVSQRSWDKQYEPWKWSIAVAGTNAKWETYESNIIKETKEEIWIEWIEFKDWEKLFNRNCFFKVFKAIIDKDSKDFVTDKDEIIDIKWIKKDDLVKEIKHNPENFTTALVEHIELLCK